MELKVKDTDGKTLTLQPSVGLYRVEDFMGKEMPGLAVILTDVHDEFNEYILTVSFGEFIGAKNCAYIDTNNCWFTDQLLNEGNGAIAVDTGLTKSSGFCTYPLWKFKEEFLKEIGGNAYQTYSDSYDQYMKSIGYEENESEVEEQQKNGMKFGDM